jgi:hypothetical protein
MSLLSKLAVAVLIITQCQGTIADPVLHEQEVTISFQSNASHEEIYRTVKMKARRACRTHAVIAYNRIWMERECMNEFMDAAIAKIARPRLTDYHLEQTGRSPGELDDESQG